MDNSNKRFIFTVILVFILLITMLAYLFTSYYFSSADLVKNLGKSKLEYETSEVDSYIQKGMSVLWVTSDAINTMIENGASNEYILEYITAQSEHEMAEFDKNFTGIYGYINGEYLDGSGWVPDDDYIPTERDWYTSALEKKGAVTIVQPYLDAKTHTIMFSLSKLLSDGKSVISFDIALNEIQTITKEINLGNMGYGFILDGDGLVIAHFDEAEKGKMYPVDESQTELINKIFDIKNGSFEIKQNDGEYTVFVDNVADNWYVVMMISSTNLFESIRLQTMLNSVVCIIVFVLVVAFCADAYKKMKKAHDKDRESRAKLKELNINIVRSLASTIDAKDHYTSGHSKRVAEYSMEIARRMGKDENEQRIVYDAGLLHDIGKIRISEDVLNKPGRLTEDEFSMIKLHPVIGYYILKDIYDDKRVAHGARYHHERYDGKGYPNSLQGVNIPEIGRIIGVADAYDAMASNRSYRNALPQKIVREEIEKGKGKQFDPNIADIMLKMIDEDKEYRMCQREPDEHTILVISKNEVDVISIEEIMSEEKCKVISAPNYEAANKTLEHTHADLIIFDISAISGDSTDKFAEIKKNCKIPLFFMIDDINSDIIKRFDEWSIADYVRKPLTPDVLREMINGIIKNPQNNKGNLLNSKTMHKEEQQ